jgi:hypothetical protein
MSYLCFVSDLFPLVYASVRSLSIAKHRIYRLLQVLLKLFALRMFIELLQARRAMGAKRNASSHKTVSVMGLFSVSPPPQPPPSDAQPSLWMHATSFLAREANRVAWRRRNSHLL